MIWLALFFICLGLFIISIKMYFSRNFAEKICNRLFINHSEQDCRDYANSKIARIYELRFAIASLIFCVWFFFNFLSSVGIF